MESRPRIHYKEKYEFYRALSLYLGVAFIFTTVWLLITINKNIEMQSKFISPNKIAAELEVG